jgi:hypothetical protein
MVTIIEPERKTEESGTQQLTPQINLQELGDILGIPIEVRPWWGSTRTRFSGKLKWICPGRIKPPEIQKGKIILWEGPCQWHLFQWRHNHSQDIEIKSVGNKAMLIRCRVNKIYSQFLVGMDEGAPYVMPVARNLETVKEAFDWLIPKPVREAMEQGLEVLRHGDWFLVQTHQKPYLYPK